VPLRALPAALALAVAGASLWTGAAGGASDAPSRDLARVGKRAFVVGDSLAVGTRPYLVRALKGWRVGHSVSISKQAPQGVGELARRGARGLPPVVVVQLGTNGDRNALSSFDHSVRTALRSVGKRGCVVWPNIVRPPGYGGYNAILRRLSARRRNLIVFNWSRMVRRNPGWLADDGVHVNATGYTARARGIANEVRECRQRVVAASEGEKKGK
jgi:lysophospholipase L1-like esterase